MSSSNGVVGGLGDPRRRAAFALACAERLAPICAEFCTREDVKSLARAVLDEGWRRLEDAGSDPARSAGLDLLRVLDEAVAAADGDLGDQHSCVDDAVSAAAYAFEAVLDGTPEAAVNAANRATEVSFQLASETWRTLTTAQLLRSPLVTAEVARQQRDADLLRESPEPAFRDLLRDLRKRARADGAELVRLLTGEAGHRPDGEPGGGQTSLF